MATFRILVNDVSESVAFYRDMLDFDLVEQFGAAFARVQKDDLELWLSGPQASAAKAMPDGREPEPGGWNRFVVVVEDIEAKVAGLRSVGVVFRNDILEGPGGKQVVIDDPSGNPIEVFEPRS